MEGIADGVGLNHVAHEAQSQGDGHGEEAGQEQTQLALEGGLDVVDGAAGDFPVGTGLLVLLGKDCLAVDGGHAEEGGNPHPEDGTGAAGGQSCGAAGDVAGAHLGGDGSGQCLEGAHAVLAGILTEELDIAENPAHTLAEFANLDEIGTDGEVNAAAKQQEQKHKPLVPQDVVDRCHDLGYDGFHNLTSFFPDKQKSPDAQCSGERKPHSRCQEGKTYSLCPFT